jgi:hypothetical protein
MTITKLRKDSDLAGCAASTGKANGQHNDSEDSSGLGRFALACGPVKRLLKTARKHG